MDLIQIFNFLIIFIFLFINGVYLFLIFISIYYIRQQARLEDTYELTGLFNSNLYKSVSILVPAYNEQENILSSVNSLLQLKYANYEIIVINDGSLDNTLDVLKEHFDLRESSRAIPDHLDHEPVREVYISATNDNLLVIDKENGGKADSLNVGINAARSELFCSIDADSVLEPDVLLRMLRAFSKEENVIAAGGIVRLANGCTIENGYVKEVNIPNTFLERIQAVEYLRAFLFGRLGWDFIKSLFIISGAFGVYKREAVLNVGGFDTDTVGEDVELVVKLHHYYKGNNIPYRIRYLAQPVCWTEVPKNWRYLSRQRNRWQRGLAYTLFKHKKMLFNPKYGRLGFWSMPFFIFFELFSPMFELFSYIFFLVQLFLGLIGYQFAFMFILVSILLGILISIFAVLCEEMTYQQYPRVSDLLVLFAYGFLENLGYRQIHSWWRFRGLIDYLKGDKEWGINERFGLGANHGESKEINEKQESSISIWLKRMGSVPYWITIAVVNMVIIFVIVKALTGF